MILLIYNFILHICINFMYFNIIVTHTQSVCVFIFTPPLSCFVFYRPTSGSVLPPNNTPPVFVLFIYTVFFFFWDTGCHIVQARLELDSWGWPWASDSPHLHLWSARIIVTDHYIGLYTYLSLDSYIRENGQYLSIFSCFYYPILLPPHPLLDALLIQQNVIQQNSHSTVKFKSRSYICLSVDSTYEW